MPKKQPTDNRSQKGLVLKEAREAKGISLETVHESTKIPLDALKAIEEGYTVRTLSVFYYRGFLKIYAKYLGVTISDVVEDCKPEKVPERGLEERRAFADDKFSFALSPKLKNGIIKVVVALLAIFLVIKIIVWLFHQKPHRAQQISYQEQKTIDKKKIQKISLKPTGNVVSDKKKNVTEAASAKQSPAILSSTTKNSSVAQAQVQSHNIDLVTRAKKDSWLEVKVDGEVVFRSTLKKGSVETWHANKNIELSGKEIGDLELELNGKILGPVASGSRKAKKVLIDHSGFSVKP